MNLLLYIILYADAICLGYVHYLEAMLKWGISRKGNFVLSKEPWTPSIELKDFYGDKVEAKQDAVPLQDIVGSINS